jgi:Fur family transcriptional regulator, ferric uptake regulator
VLSPADTFREYLAARGKRLTRERNAVIDVVFANQGSFDTEQLYHWVSNGADGPRASRATAYRLLLEMVSAGLLRKVARDKREVFEHDKPG